MSNGMDFRLADGSVLSLGSRLSPAVSGISAKRDLAAEDELRFHFGYQARYTKALRAVKALALDRYHEFRKCYEPDPKRRGVGYVTYVIQDYIKGIALNSILYTGFDSRKRTVQCLANQIAILGSLGSFIDSVLSNTEASLQADLQDVELETAKSLIKESPHAARALAGACDTATWRTISYLADIPNMCTHRRSTDPTAERVMELIEGADCVAKNVI
jgi:hypothetical protein